MWSDNLSDVQLYNKNVYPHRMLYVYPHTPRYAIWHVHWSLFIGSENKYIDAIMLYISLTSPLITWSTFTDAYSAPWNVWWVITQQWAICIHLFYYVSNQTCTVAYWCVLVVLLWHFCDIFVGRWLCQCNDKPMQTNVGIKQSFPEEICIWYLNVIKSSGLLWIYSKFMS